MPSATHHHLSRQGRRDVAWAVRHRGDCVPEATSGRADPDRGGRHQHSLRDLDGCSAGDAADGAQAAAPLVDTPAAPGCDEWRPSALPRQRRPQAEDVPPDEGEPADIDGVLRVEPLTGISVVVGPVPAGLSAAVTCRVEEAIRIQALAGGVRPGDCDTALARALMRRSGAAVNDAGVASVSTAVWEIMADGDLGMAQGRSDAGRRSHGISTSRPLGLTPRQLAEQCRAKVSEIETRAAAAALVLGEGSSPPLDAAVLEQVRRNPDTAERGIAAALAGMGATQGRVYRALCRLGLKTRAARHAWVAAGCPPRGRPDPTPADIAAAAARLAADDDPGLAPLYRYHLAAAYCRRDPRRGAAASTAAS